MRNFSTENGLPSNGIKGLQWDEQTQLLWIATEAGIVRYDGLTFKTFTTDDDKHLSDKRFMYLVKNNAGTIYTADEGGSIFRVDSNTIHFKEKKPFGVTIVDNHFTVTVSDRLSAHNIEPVPGLAFPPASTAAIPLSDTSCLLVNSDSVYYFSVSLKAPKSRPLPGISLKRIFLIDKAVFLEDKQQRIFQYDHETGRLSHTSVVSAGNEFALTSSTVIIWHNGIKFPIAFSKDEAWRLYYTNGKVTAEKICDAIPSGILVVHAQYHESSGTLFIATASKGLYIVKKNVLESLKAKNYRVPERISYYSQLELPNGNVLTNAGHVVGKNRQDQHMLPIDGPFDLFLYKSGDSILWYIKSDAELRNSYLNKLDLRTGHTTVLTKCRTSVQPIITEAAGSVYVADIRGLWKLVDDSLVSIDNRITTYTFGLPYDMKEISPGVLGIATCSTFLKYTIATKKLDTIYTSGGHCIRTMWLYKDYVFFGTYGGGLYVYRNGKVKALPLDKNKYLLFTHCFMEDDYGFCWISTNRGLFKVKTGDMIAAFESDVNEIYYHYFGKNDGMEMTEMNGGCVPCAIELKNKIISFPTMDGLVWVDPSNASSSLPGGNIYIDELKVNGKKVNTDSLQYLKLNAANGEIEIKLLYTAWNNPENLYISYSLDGNNDWKEVAENDDDITTLRFVNLQPGEHHLRIKKANGFGIGNFVYKDIFFTIATPWYRQWWFYLLSGLFVIGIVRLIIRLRTREYRRQQFKLESLVFEKTRELQEKNVILEKNDSIKSRLISIISHDIITPLKFLAVTGNKLVQRKNLMTPEMLDETIIDMSRTSKELQTLSTNILNWIKYQNEGRGLVKDSFDLHEMTEQVIAILEPVANQKNMEILNDVEAETLVFQHQEPLKILLYNVVSNAVNFSDGGSITITSHASGDDIILSVTDEGIGMTKEQVDNITSDKPITLSSTPVKGKGHGLGYLIIRDLLKVTGAVLKIESEPGAGTTVHIRFKVTEPSS